MSPLQVGFRIHGQWFNAMDGFGNLSDEDLTRLRVLWKIAGGAAEYEKNYRLNESGRPVPGLSGMAKPETFSEKNKSLAQCRKALQTTFQTIDRFRIPKDERDFFLQTLQTIHEKIPDEVTTFSGKGNHLPTIVFWAVSYLAGDEIVVLIIHSKCLSSVKNLNLPMAARLVLWIAQRRDLLYHPALTTQVESLKQTLGSGSFPSSSSCAVMLTWRSIRETTNVRR